MLYITQVGGMPKTFDNLGDAVDWLYMHVSNSVPKEHIMKQVNRHGDFHTSYGRTSASVWVKL